jgi:hypothetical protein
MRAAGSVILVAALACGCSRPPALANTFSSEHALADRVLGALAARDIAALQALSLSEREFREAVWPELPSSRPEMNVPVEYAWRTLAQNSAGHLYETIRAHGGRRYDLVRVQFDRETSRYGSFTVLRGSRLIVRDERGTQLHLRLFGSILERDGRFKLFSYVAD